MKIVSAITLLALGGCSTFNGAVDGAQEIVATTVDSAQTMVVDTAKGIGSGSATAVEGVAKDIRSASE